MASFIFASGRLRRPSLHILLVFPNFTRTGKRFHEMDTKNFIFVLSVDFLNKTALFCKLLLSLSEQVCI